MTGSTRVEAFSDGVLAIAVTLLVLDLHLDFERGSFAHGLGTQWPSASSSSRNAPNDRADWYG